MDAEVKTAPGLGTQITARIGRSGAKVHPAWAEVLPGGRYRIVMFACSCGGTHNGSATQRAQVVGEGWAARTCGG